MEHREVWIESDEICGAWLDEHVADEMRVPCVRRDEPYRESERRIGSGEQIGPESFDTYEMEYLFIIMDGRWMMEKLRFTSPPKVGAERSNPFGAPADFHGGMKAEPQYASPPPGVQAPSTDAPVAPAPVEEKSK